MSVRPGRKFGFQSAAENLQLRRWADRLRQTVPDRCNSRWKGAVANGRTHRAWSDQRWCIRRAQSSTCVDVWRPEDLRPGSQVQSRGGSDTLALSAETKRVLASEASAICAVTTEWTERDTVLLIVFVLFSENKYNRVEMGVHSSQGKGEYGSNSKPNHARHLRPKKRCFVTHQMAASKTDFAFYQITLPLVITYYYAR